MADQNDKTGKTIVFDTTSLSIVGFDLVPMGRARFVIRRIIAKQAPSMPNKFHMHHSIYWNVCRMLLQHFCNSFFVVVFYDSPLKHHMT